MNLPVGRRFRLVAKGGAGLSCEEEGIALGGVSLVRLTPGGGENRRYVVRPIEEVGGILRLAYGPQVGNVIERCHQGLGRAAARLETGDLALAALEAVMTGFPDLAPRALAKLAQLVELEKASTAWWEDEPRVPAGQPDGGQWTTGGSGANARTNGARSEICAPTRILRELTPDDLRPVKGELAPPTPEVRLFETWAQEAIHEVHETLTAGGIKISPQARGIMIHALFEAKVAAALGLDHAETSYLNGAPVRRGAAGSSRADAIFGPLAHPTLAVEMKTGGAQLYNGQLKAYGRNLPPKTPLLLIRIEAQDK